MGFNTIRKHIKIEPSRWYYYCDKLGMLVWQDMPTAANLSSASKKEFETETKANIEQLFNYPCIITWVIFNEGWNKFDQERITTWVKGLDRTRIVDGHSGENYDKTSPHALTKKWINSDLTDIHDYPGPGIAPYISGKARVLGEWGGVRVPTLGHKWNIQQGWGYIESEAKEFERKYYLMMAHLKVYKEEGLSGAIFTQPFDVEIEENGLITYDRDYFKISLDRIAKINRELLGAK
jgi:beta-galactosidase/beta-glucuronidase